MGQARTNDGLAAWASWREALAVSEWLAPDFPGSVDMQTTQVVQFAGVARHLDPTNATARVEASGLLDRAIDVPSPLAEAGQLDAQRRGWIAWIRDERIKLGQSSPSP